jgi:hypothetical protein
MLFEFVCGCQFADLICRRHHVLDFCNPSHLKAQEEPIEHGDRIRIGLSSDLNCFFPLLKVDKRNATGSAPSTNNADFNDHPESKQDGGNWLDLTRCGRPGESWRVGSPLAASGLGRWSNGMEKCRDRG